MTHENLRLNCLRLRQHHYHHYEIMSRRKTLYNIGKPHMCHRNNLGTCRISCRLKCSK
ncbi:hypothetical protein BDV29DRAFT_167914 [Aspergillus leporis]|uniref:Uncharacterized protein n=1 Tax=Aspergillus leporis TaxID=41062 RepID=A0A5N5XC65_9EURO|nr:hypothetical protein BDV29DRAFT_167914 [Aspergillus leporis]